MKMKIVPIAMALVAAGTLTARAENPNADLLLKQMSAKLAAAHSFSFTATREIDSALVGDEALVGKATVSVTVQRPNKFRGRATGKGGARRFVFDGHTLALLDEKMNHYATVPMRTTLDGLVARLDEQYGFTPPLAEFAMSNPYAEFHRQAQTITWLGRKRTGGCLLGLCSVECDRLGLKGKEADAELWIGATDHLPRKLVATFHRPGRPQVRVEFTGWKLAAPVTAAEFTFTPPAGARKIEIWTTAKMQASRKH